MKTLSKVILVLTLFLVGCGPQSVSGEVVRKEYDPAHTRSWLWCHPVGKATVCQPMITHEPDDWMFIIDDREQEKYVTWHVTEEIYNQYEVGDYFSESHEQK